jgi:two-component system, OmpR family, sensor histidine kinase KdpD
MQNPDIQDHWKSGRKLLAAAGPGPNSDKIIHWVRRLAESLNAPWTVLYVEGPPALSEAAQARLTRNLALAREWGAEVITTSDDDVVRGLLRVAAQRNVTGIIVGKSAAGPFWKRWQRDRLLRRLMRQAGPIEVHIVPVQGAMPATDTPKTLRQKLSPRGSTLMQYLAAFGAVAVVTLAAFLFTPLIGSQATALIFLLSVVVLALFVPRGPTLFAAAMSALLWDFFFVPPVFAFRIARFEDVVLFGVYVVIALVLGQLTARIRAQEEAERLREKRATTLYLLTRELIEATTLEQIVERAAHRLEQVFKAHVVVLLSDPDELGRFYPGGKLSGDDQLAAAWALQHGQPAGRFTDNCPMASFFYAPLATSAGAAGVVGLQLTQSSPPTIHQLNLLDAFGQQIVLAVDRHRLQQVSERARLLVESERLSKTLLDSVSHEIRTPIAAIKGAAGNLAELMTAAPSGPQLAMIAEIQEATERLNRLVGNILDVTRLGSGGVKPRFDECDVAELVHLAVAETEQELARHPLTVDIAPGLPIVPMDFVLMQQVLANLLSNAARHTPPGTPVQIAASVEHDSLLLVIADHGPGLAPGLLPHIFDKFYRAPNATTGGTGLGLSLVRGFVEAQGGRVTAENARDGGMAFTIRLPLCKTSPRLASLLSAQPNP